MSVNDILLWCPFDTALEYLMGKVGIISFGHWYVRDVHSAISTRALLRASVKDSSVMPLCCVLYSDCILCEVLLCTPFGNR